MRRLRFGYRRQRWWWCWDCLAGPVWVGEKRVEWRHFAFPLSLCCAGAAANARCKVQGARVQHQAPSKALPRSGHGLLIFDFVHGPPAVGPHRPLAAAHWSRRPRAGDAPALGHPTVYQLAGALTSLGQELTNWYCVRHVLCSCLHSIFLPVAR